MKHTKSITTRKVKTLKLIDRLVWLVPLAFAALFLLTQPWAELYAECAREAANMGIAVLLFFLLFVAIVSLPVVAIWLAVSKTLKRSAIKKTTFNVLHDLDYYRDQLTGISPTVISMLTDLAIEPKKDISALILKYTLMGVVSTENGVVLVKNMDHPDLLPSDRYLLNAISANQLNAQTAWQWANMAKAEALQTNYFRNAQPKINGCATSCSIGCLIPLLIVVAVGLFAYSPMYASFASFVDSLDETMSNAEVIRYMLNTSDAALTTFAASIMAVLTFAAFILPIAAIVYLIVKLVSHQKVTRTPAGDELTEEIYGMKNFIHDFSNLAEADKEQLILWDDFLIYAVVLEENTSIVDEICGMKNISVINFNL